VSEKTDPGSRPAPAAASPAPDDGKLDPALLRLAATVMLGAVMVILDTTIVSVAIRDLGKQFHASLSTISWVTTGYLLALAVVIPLTGWAVERFGARRMWNLSLAMFVAGSALCGVAWSAGALVAFRVLQGLGGGMIMPICMTLLARAAGPQRMGRVMSIIGVPTLIAPVLGPVIGGVIVDHLSWRWIFYVNVPLGVLALFLSSRVLSRDQGSAGNRLDVTGLLLISPGLAGVVYGLSEAGNGGGFGSAKVEISIIVGVVLLVGFVLHALRGDSPLLDMKLFANKNFSAAGIATFMIGAMLFAAMFLLPLYYQVDRGYSASDAGLLLAPQGLGAMLVMSRAGRISDERGAGWVVPVGMAVALLGTLPFTMIDGHTNVVWLAVALFVRGLGFGAAMMPAMGAAYQTLAPAAVPRASTALNILQRVGGSVATALVAVELQHNITGRVPAARDGASVLAGTGTKLPGPVADKVGGAFAATTWWVVALTAVGFVASLFLPRRPASAEALAPAGQPAPERVPVAVD
jgi:EmrB/QacA subfamily drug resistance transporter